MKNRFKFLGIIAVAIIGFSMTGCATNTTGVRTGWDQNQVPLFATGETVYIRNHTILRVVQIEGAVRRILRMRVPFTTIEGSLFTFMDVQVTYANLLAEAQRLFPQANAVTSVQIDYIDSNIWFFFSSRRYIATGLAIQVAATQ